MVSCEKKDMRQFCYSEGLEFKKGGKATANESFGIFLETFRFDCSLCLYEAPRVSKSYSA